MTDVASLWNHLHEHTRAAQGGEVAPTGGRELRMTATLNPFDALAIAESSSAANTRAALRDALQTKQLLSDNEKSRHAALADSLDVLTSDVVRLGDAEAQFAFQITASAPSVGFELPAVQRLVVGFGRTEPPIFVGSALFIAPQISG